MNLEKEVGFQKFPADHPLIAVRHVIVAGHYGSGKSEVAVNLALQKRLFHEEVTLMDMDIVNPFFRSADAMTLLKNKDIRLIGTVYANTNVDVPAVPAAMSAAFHETGHIVLDVGGDDDGARVLGRYHKDVRRGETIFAVVVNTSRPMSRNVEAIRNQVMAITAASRQPVTHLIANTHFMNETTAEDVLQGLKVAMEASDELNLPILAVCAMRKELFPDSLPEGITALLLEKTMRSA